MSDTLPKHVAIIMDGNGRWAKKRFLPRTAGHKAGIKSARTIIEAALKRDIKVLSFFVFSTENWRRPKGEVDVILSLFLKALTEDVNKLHENNIRFKVIGDSSQFSNSIQMAITAAETLTQHNTAMTLILAANYGGQWDVTQAVKQIAGKVLAGSLLVDDIDQEIIAAHLTTHEFPHPDLFIRTSGEQRISNFYLWQLAYSELYFPAVAWPDFSSEELDKALDFFAKRERRYGYTSEQVKDKINA